MSDYKLVIVGAGVAGLYAAWRLCADTQTLQPSDVLLLETSDRTGGRLRTWTLDQFDPSFPADPTVRAELGGMRILNYNIYVCSLANQLKLPIVPFPADVAENWHYLRGQTIQGGDYPRQTIYPLAPNEQGWTPGDVVYQPLVPTGIVPAGCFPTPDGKITQRDFVNMVMRNTEVDGIPAWRTGFWNAILASGQALNPAPNDVSFQAYAYFLEAGAYDTIPSNWNASVAFSNLLGDFSSSPSYWALRDGYQRLPDALAEGLADAGVAVKLDVTVTGLFSADGGGLTLTLDGGGMVTADQVVLAMPPRAVETIAGNQVVPAGASGAPLADQMRRLRQSAPIPLLKVFLVYDQDWWSAALGTDWPAFTRMTTDLPMRQIYNFGQTQGSDGKTYHLFQAVYCDALKAGYWAGQMPQEAENSGEDVNTDIFARIENLAGSTIETGTLRFNLADRLQDFPLFATAHQQFATLVQAVGESRGGGPVAPIDPLAGAAMNWGTEPFGGGVNFWNVGVELDDGKGGGAYWDMMNPAPGVYIVGEGYSLYQGWVEGALWSAEDMLGRFFGLDTPAWLDTRPYSGPGEHVPVTAPGQGAAAL